MGGVATHPQWVGSDAAARMQASGETTCRCIMSVVKGADAGAPSLLTARRARPDRRSTVTSRANHQSRYIVCVHQPVSVSWSDRPGRHRRSAVACYGLAQPSSAPPRRTARPGLLLGSSTAFQWCIAATAARCWSNQFQRRTWTPPTGFPFPAAMAAPIQHRSSVKIKGAATP